MKLLVIKYYQKIREIKLHATFKKYFDKVINELVLRGSNCLGIFNQNGKI